MWAGEVGSGSTRSILDPSLPGPHHPRGTPLLFGFVAPCLRSLRASPGPPLNLIASLEPLESKLASSIMFTTGRLLPWQYVPSRQRQWFPTYKRSSSYPLDEPPAECIVHSTKNGTLPHFAKEEKKSIGHWVPQLVLQYACRDKRPTVIHARITLTLGPTSDDEMSIRKTASEKWNLVYVPYGVRSLQEVPRYNRLVGARD